MRSNPRADIARVAQVLAGVAFPAATWQLIMHAEEYGADATSRTQLRGLPAGGYADLPAVLAALGLVTGPETIGYRTAPAVQAAARDEG